MLPPPGPCCRANDGWLTLELFNTGKASLPSLDDEQGKVRAPHGLAAGPAGGACTSSLALLPLHAQLTLTHMRPHCRLSLRCRPSASRRRTAGRASPWRLARKLPPPPTRVRALPPVQIRLVAAQAELRTPRCTGCWKHSMQVGAMLRPHW